MGMMMSIAKAGRKLGAKRAGILLVAVASVAAIGAAPATAKADTQWRVGIEIGDRHDHGPRYEERVTRVWCPPVYRTECDRVWVQPVYRTECERVFVPDRYEIREVVRYHGSHRHVYQERVLVERAHYESRDRQVLVRAGYWQNVERQVLVSAGHYEDRVERVAVRDYDRGGSRVQFGFGRR